MDFKALRAARNKKAADRVNSGGGKVDASDWTPDEKLDADVKTGMRPISRRAFKTGGKVDGDEAKTNLSRAGRKPISADSLQNRDLKEANEDREGKKHVGGFKSGGKINDKIDDLYNVGEGKPKDTTRSLYRVGKKNVQSIDDVRGAVNKSLKKAGGGAADSGVAAQAADDDAAWAKAHPDVAAVQRRETMRPKARPADLDVDKDIGSSEQDGMKRGGAAKKKYEGSPKDNLIDAKMAKKKGMSKKEWEASPEDKRMDAKGGCADGCTCSKCRTARATGGRTKGKTNIVINVMPHTAAKPPAGIPDAPPAIAAPPPMGGGMPPPPPMHLPPGLGAAMAGAAGAPPMPPPGGPGPMPMPMARKSGGKVYPITTGAGGAKARLDKIKAYGLKQK